MPELPEVTTTVTGLEKVLPKMIITDVWTDLAKRDQKIRQFRETIKNEKFFIDFKKKVVGQRVIRVRRRAKNILIDISHGHTILIHLKMTGHLLFGEYKQDKKSGKWYPKKEGALTDPFNRFIHVVFSFKKESGQKKYLVFCDARKFGKITIFKTEEVEQFKNIGPEPLEDSFAFSSFKKRLLLKPRGKIKTVLMDQSIIAGIGNIYSDEMLWTSGINPKSLCSKIPDDNLKLLYKSMRKILLKSISLGGDSMSDYRNIKGEKGNFQNYHNVYKKSGQKCSKNKCCGIIKREVIAGRSTHFCLEHQKLFK